MEVPSTPASLKRTPLYRLHRDLEARMTGFGGWEMPVQYVGITAEHQAVRQSVGMFDISHMGKFVCKGKDLIAHLQPLVPSDLSQLQPGDAKYTLLLNAQAGILDDLIVYYQGEDARGEQQVILIVNAATTEKDKSWILNHLNAQAIDFQDISSQKTLIAVQGPRAIATLQSLVDVDLEQLKTYGHAAAQVLDHPVWLARTGYTGEDGLEIMSDPELGQQLWRSLLELGVTPCGLGARDTLRLEAAMALYGQEIDESTTPLEAGLGWLISWQKGDFIGAKALQEQKQAGVQRRLVGLQMQGRHIARHGYPVLYADKTVGVVTSGTLSPTLGRAIALAYLPTEFTQPGQEVMVDIRGKACPGAVVSRPFYRRSRQEAIAAQPSK